MYILHTIKVSLLLHERERLPGGIFFKKKKKGKKERQQERKKERKEEKERKRKKKKKKKFALYTQAQKLSDVLEQCTHVQALTKIQPANL